MMVTLVPQHLVDATWPNVTIGFQKASKRFGGDLSVGELWQMCRSGNAFLFVVHDDKEIIAATAWRPELWGSGPKFRCLALFGAGMAEWMPDLHEKVRQTAILCGATALMSEGRTGWARIFPKARVLRAVYEEAIDGR